MTPPDEFPTDWSGLTEVPKETGSQKDWQKLNRNWWENNPMRYDQGAGVERILVSEGTLEYFRANDEHFLSDAKTYMPWKHKPLDLLTPFSEIAAVRVLEIGVGLGGHAPLPASNCREYVGINLTERAVRLTTKRLALLGLANAAVVQMDAAKLEIPDAIFDFICSWDVIYHSSNTPAIINEIHRVLKPCGRVVPMVYHRSICTIGSSSAFSGASCAVTSFVMALSTKLPSTTLTGHSSAFTPPANSAICSAHGSEANARPFTACSRISSSCFPESGSSSGRAGSFRLRLRASSRIRSGGAVSSFATPSRCRRMHPVEVLFRDGGCRGITQSRTK